MRRWEDKKKTVYNQIRSGKDKKSQLLNFSFPKLLFLLFTIHYSLFTIFGCGYTLQTRENLPFDTISVGQIKNKTLEPKLQDRFNRVLAETFAEYGFSVSPSSRYILEGEITKFDLKPLAEQLLTATQYEVVIKADFILIDKESGRSIPLVAGSPFITYFSSTGTLESVMAQKEISTISALKNLSQEVVRRINYDTPKNFAYLLFSVNDIKDINSLAQKLREGKDPLSVYLREQFSPNTKQLLKEYDMSKEASERLRSTMINELNQILQGISIFQEKRFAHVKLTEEIRGLIKQNPGGINLILLNRLLLEEAYPNEITKAKRNLQKKRDTK